MQQQHTTPFDIFQSRAMLCNLLKELQEKMCIFVSRMQNVDPEATHPTAKKSDVERQAAIQTYIHIVCRFDIETPVTEIATIAELVVKVCSKICSGLKVRHTGVEEALRDTHAIITECSDFSQNLYEMNYRNFNIWQLYVKNNAKNLGHMCTREYYANDQDGYVRLGLMNQCLTLLAHLMHITHGLLFLHCHRRYVESATKYATKIGPRLCTEFYEKDAMDSAGFAQSYNCIQDVANICRTIHISLDDITRNGVLAGCMTTEFYDMAQHVILDHARAFAEATHSRLGVDSPAKSLHPELVARIARDYFQA